MILPNLRQRLSETDLAIVRSCLAAADPARPVEPDDADPGAWDDLLDAPELPALLRERPGYGAPSAALFIYVTVRHSLLRIGVDDRRLADYVGTLVHEFALRDRAWRIGRHDDAQFRYLTDILSAAEETEGRRGFLLRVHLGNFSLWLAGIFPDFVSARRRRRGGPGLGYYEALGARGFRMASDHRCARQFELSDLYAQVADSFAQLRVALNRLSDQALFRKTTSPERLMRQAADDFRFPPQDPLF